MTWCGPTISLSLSLSLSYTQPTRRDVLFNTAALSRGCHNGFERTYGRLFTSINRSVHLPFPGQRIEGARLELLCTLVGFKVEQGKTERNSWVPERAAKSSPDFPFCSAEPACFRSAIAFLHRRYGSRATALDGFLGIFVMEHVGWRGIL
uniref:Uncharacterized protein n=1 Tax=Grammatophora oceanica TaxID=210454 RepID=A0A7S1UPI5_9STRA|mmetsp:Transcript_15226/g.22334  ORF Transcript_15226/g.22334 Transcript_15226/m.22334 type:complete len:150 (+) Transcript_15226:60-509(+)